MCVQAATPSDLADWLDVLQQTRAAALARHGLTEGRRQPLLPPLPPLLPPTAPLLPCPLILSPPTLPPNTFLTRAPPSPASPLPAPPRLKRFELLEHPRPDCSEEPSARRARRLAPSAPATVCLPRRLSSADRCLAHCRSHEAPVLRNGPHD